MNSISDQLREVASDILSGALTPIEGSRKIDGLRFSADDPDHEVFDPFILVTSETDALPVGNERAHWNKDALIAKDKEVFAYEGRRREYVREACENLIEYLSQP